MCEWSLSGVIVKKYIHIFYFFTVSARHMSSKTQVGFVGLGNMGNPMAKNLLKHGYPVVATDVFPEFCKEVQELGAQVVQVKFTHLFLHLFCNFFYSEDGILCILQIVDNPAEVADKADRIITMLPSSPNVIDVYTGPNGILK